MAEVQQSPDDCVSCGVNYEGHERYVAQVKAQRQAEQAANVARAKRSPVVYEAEQQYPGAQPVVVVDINMSFGAMVRFMVKWVIASIPALIILFLLFTGVPAFFATLLRIF
ncbi:hypothetical protein [Ectopseudomonas mendocina]|uniref:hypothetical protein n=1 Tax=Ectopseudomonas mendocina TaxID=300 RepID=UPI00131A5F21|nr:hypothetical protein [Pseudomonas mendocina]